MIAMGLPAMEHQVASPSGLFNPVVRQTFGSVLINIGIPKVCGIQQFVESDTSGKVVNKSRTGNLFVSCLAVNADGQPSTQNRVGNLEIQGGQFNNKFWGNHMHRCGGGQRLELACWIPQFLLTEADRVAHNDLVDGLNDQKNEGDCTGLGGEFFKLTLWNGHGGVMKHMMNSLLVQKARIAGFFPLFCIKQCINQQSWKEGVKRALSSTNLNGRTSVMLVGFWANPSPGQAGTPEEFRNLTLVSMSAQNSFVTQTMQLKGSNN